MTNYKGTDLHDRASILSSPTHKRACFTATSPDSISQLLYWQTSVQSNLHSVTSTLFTGCWQHPRWQYEHNYHWCCQLRLHVPGHRYDRSFRTQSAAVRLLRGHDTLADGAGNIFLPEGPHRNRRCSIWLATACQLCRLCHRLLIWIWSNPVAHDGRDLTR